VFKAKPIETFPGFVRAGSAGSRSSARWGDAASTPSSRTMSSPRSATCTARTSPRSLRRAPASPGCSRSFLRAVSSPATYVSHVLSGSLYLLVAALALGYAIALKMIDALDHWSTEEQTSQTGPHRAVIAHLARWRWFWLPPLYALASVFLLIITLTRGASTAQFMYRKF